jgi:glyoxylase-like metal-dependent hydrolase (beta-lactamase superfamily II)
MLRQCGRYDIRTTGLALIYGQFGGARKKANAIDESGSVSDIPFDQKLELPPGQVEEVASGVRRLLCNNPSPFTFKGTLSYIVGRGRVAIVDPGPDDADHIAALLGAVKNETVTHIFVTHTHRDHSPAVPAIKAATGAIVLAEGPHRPAISENRYVSTLATISTFALTARSPTARSSTARAGPSRL